MSVSQRAALYGSWALALALCSCAQRATSAPSLGAPPPTYQPCALELGTLEFPVAESFALAAGDNACLLIDESKEATFVSVASLMDDEEGFELLRDDLRAFLRTSGIVGAPRFTARAQSPLLGQEVETHTFVATPPGLPERAGFVVRARFGGGIVLFIGLSDTPDHAVALRHTIDAVRPSP
ncbi:MAG: hypothetical protein ACI9KE_002927 [Polyangiales bacterium]